MAEEKKEKPKSGRGGIGARSFYSKQKVREMVDLGKRLAVSGKSTKEIGEAWAQLGFCNPNTKEPLKQSSVSKILIDNGFRRHKPGKPRGIAAARAKARGEDINIPVAPKPDAVAARRATVAKQKEVVYHGDNHVLTMIADLLTAPGLTMETRCTAIKELAKNL